MSHVLINGHNIISNTIPVYCKIQFINQYFVLLLFYEIYKMVIYWLEIKKKNELFHLKIIQKHK